MKTCTKCKKELDISMFFADNQKSDNLTCRCKNCLRESINTDRRKKYEKKYWDEKREKRRVISAKCYEKQKEKRKIQNKKYRSTEDWRIKNRIWGMNRRRKIKGKITKDELLELYQSSPNCFYCYKPLKLSEVEFDHFIPIVKGDINHIGNMRVSCMTCNRKKGGGYYQMVSAYIR